jgi:hypothetical protein
MLTHLHKAIERTRRCRGVDLTAAPSGLEHEAVMPWKQWTKGSAVGAGSGVCVSA